MARPVGPDGRKSAVLTLRLTPKVRFGLELMSRVHKETIPEIVANAIAQSLTAEYGGLFVFTEESKERPKNLLELIWDERPSDRLINLAVRYPSVMSRTELAIWQRIRQTPKYWRSERARKAKSPADSAVLRDVVAADWEAISRGVGAFATAFARMPNVGLDSEFERVNDIRKKR